MGRLLCTLDPLAIEACLRDGLSSRAGSPSHRRFTPASSPGEEGATGLQRRCSGWGLWTKSGRHRVRDNSIHLGVHDSEDLLQEMDPLAVKFLSSLDQSVWPWGHK